MLRKFSVTLAVITILGLAAPPVSAAERHRARYTVMEAHDVPSTPNDLDVMPVVKHWYGRRKPATPEVVAIMVPGFFGGAEGLTYVGERLVERSHDTQVWIVERRNNLLEQRCAMEAAQEDGYGKTQLAAAYHLQGSNLLGPGVCPSASDDPDPEVWDGLALESFLSQPEAADVGMPDWGLETELRDIRKVVREARRRYPKAKIVLGGHSLGGMTAQLFAGWRFGAKPRSAGWRSLDGLVLIDGAVNGDGWESVMVPQAFETRAELNAGMNYWDDFDGGRTFLLGLLAEIGGMAAIQSPDSESFIWTSLVGPLTWPDATTCPTNEAAFGGLTDDQFGFSATFELHQGDLSGPLPGPVGGTKSCSAPNEDRDLVGWIDFDDSSLAGQQEISSTARWAHSMFDARKTNGVEWYFSTVLNADIDIASNLDSRAEYTVDEVTRTAADEFGHRVWDTARVKIPVYGFIAAFCRDNYDWYVGQADGVSGLKGGFRYVDRSAEHCDGASSDPYAHVDPLFAEDEGGYTNDFFKTVTRWIAKRVR